MTLAVGYHITEGKVPPRSYPASTALHIDLTGSAYALQSPLALARLYFKGMPDIESMARQAQQSPFQNIVIGNEPNLPIEQFPGGADRFADYWTRIALAVPDKKVFYPGPSPGVLGWQDWICHPGSRAAVAKSAGIAVHAYGELEQIKDVIWWYAQTFPGVQLFLSEFNFGAGQTVDINQWAKATIRRLLDWIKAAVPACVAATYFAWEWSNDTPTPTPVDAEGTAVAAEIDAWVAANPYHVEEAKPMLKGIDVSNWQESVDWPAVAASGVRFAFMKSTEDPDFYDRWFKANWEGSKAAGLVRGAYHFAQPSKASPSASVSMLESSLSFVGGLQPGDLIALDIESGNGDGNEDLSVWVAEWCDLAERVFGVRPFIYSGHWFMEPHGLEIDFLGKYPLWYASYQETEPPPPYGWHDITVWQNSASATVPGVKGDCDTNVFAGTVDELRALGYQGGAVVDPPVDPVTALRDATWRLAGDWAAAGYPWTAEGLRAIVALNKGEK